MPESPPLWYFAYGSNLDPGTFLGRRKMRPLETCCARLDEFALCFDLPVGPGERAVANLRRCPGEHVWGVVYRITAGHFDWLDRTEGVHRGFYHRAAVDVRLAAGGSCRAFTYLSDRGHPGRKPSARYLGLLLTGARHHGLPDDYIQALRTHELAVDERESDQRELPLND